MSGAGSPTAVARRAARGDAVRAGARAGFVARGVLYLFVGVLAVRIGVTGAHEQADRGGALTEVAATPFGAVLLWALGVGLAGMALWRLTEAVFGAAGPDGDSAGKRALSGVRFVFYAFVSFLVLSFAAGARGSGAGSSDRQSQDVTGRLLGLPGGQWWVGAAAVGILVAGLWIAGRAALRKFRKHLKRARMSRSQRLFMDVTGVAGGVSRGLVLAAVGFFALKAAVQFDPAEAKGMDDAIRSFAQAPAGRWLLIAVAAGLLLFGAYSFGLARWRKV
ncbi:DUF1206 domain-containing protein [Streptomyces sp. ISL-36]|uniref:DUF1206 domain-containing protein n=1 Tax=Streptomyces sp. ISL-36 TaxID=2819182 RepID=UPI001BED317D|nr:DUF1206 domain-containing protein [Streptomyces sp. ISL-36]MBT2444098.1 DUF1206 domain-containing protein [Streptomyces sp. ISL-36]